MWNVDFSHVCPSFDLRRVNALELAMLEALRYFIKVLPRPSLSLARSLSAPAAISTHTTGLFPSPFRRPLNVVLPLTTSLSPPLSPSRLAPSPP